MSELDDALLRLERAVARLEAVASSKATSGAAQDPRVAAVAAGVAAKIDAALARLGLLLGREE